MPQARPAQNAMADPVVAADEDLHLAAEEELGHALCLSWRELRDHVPYGDTFEGFDPSGRQVEFERAYLWRDHDGGEILCEVAVRRSGRDGTEVKLAGRICEGGCND